MMKPRALPNNKLRLPTEGEAFSQANGLLIFTETLRFHALFTLVRKDKVVPVLN
jgi:hypothetical protein